MNRNIRIYFLDGYDEFFATESKVPTFDPMVYPDTFDTTFQIPKVAKFGGNDQRCRSYVP